MTEIKCRTCGKICTDWGELSNHTLEQIKIKNDPHKKDKRGIAWAKKYKHRNAIKKLMEIGKEMPYRQQLTEEQKQAKTDTRRILSGETKAVPTKCPRCRKGSKKPIEMELEIEYIESEQALKDGDCFVILCNNCR
jgi:uncharacterized metal-binding protein YceD (DUF177 family)